MPWFSLKLPISEEARQWVNYGFSRLERMLGRKRLLEAKVVKPTAEDFPDPYDKTPEAAALLFSRVCGYMNVDRSCITLEIFPDETEELKELLPAWRSDGHRGAAGLYIHAHEKGRTSEEGSSGMVVAIRSSMLKDPTSLVATMAHELGHVILLGGNLLTHDSSDHEPLTDLLTVFLGLGIFTAIRRQDSSSFRTIGAPAGQFDVSVICQNPFLVTHLQNSRWNVPNINPSGRGISPQTYIRILSSQCGGC